MSYRIWRGDTGSARGCSFKIMSGPRRLALVTQARKKTDAMFIIMRLTILHEPGGSNQQQTRPTSDMGGLPTLAGHLVVPMLWV